MGAALATSDLESLEQVIANGLRTFVDVGQALTRIRDGELYKAEHRTFEAYCSERWGFSRRRAYQFMEASEVVENVQKFTQSPPTTESHAAPLAKLALAEQPKAWAEAVKTAPDGHVTAKHVAAVVAERMPKEEPRTLQPTPEAATAPGVEDEDLEPESFELEDERVATEPEYTEGEVSVSRLRRLAEQRNSDSEYASLRAMQRAVAKSLPSRGQRMIDFVLDGGELALLRLGLDWAVTEDTLRRAYRAESRAAHPDGGGSQAEFLALNDANKLVRTMLGLEAS